MEKIRKNVSSSKQSNCILDDRLADYHGRYSRQVRQYKIPGFFTAESTAIIEAVIALALAG